MNALLEYSSVAVILGVLFLFFLRVPAEYKLGMIAFTSIFQFYVISFGSINPSLSLILSVSLIPLLLHTLRAVARQGLVKLIFGLIAVQSLSLLWSSDARLGLQVILSSILFLLVFAAAYSLEVRSHGAVRRILVAVVVLLIFEALLVIVFRLRPQVELAFLRSPVAGVLIEPNTLRSLLDGSLPNNILDPAKAGGFFVNGNVAAVYLGMGAFFAWGLATGKRKRALRWIGLLLWTAALLTGSKAGLLLGIGLPVLGWLLSLQARLGWRRWLTAAIAMSLLAMVVFTALYGFVDVGQLAESNGFDVLSATALVRLNIWEYGWQAFLQNPILGQGFGGWQIGFARYASIIGLRPFFPPHNTLIYLWSQSGLIAASLGILFIVSVLRLSYRLHLSPSQPRATWGRMFGLAVLWLFVQGLGENYGLVGDNHLVVLFALGLAVTMHPYAIPRKIARGSRADSHLPPSAIQSV